MTTIKYQLNRREWLKKTGVLATGLAFSKVLIASTSKKDPTILLVSGWQDVNIGDIAHTPGLLHVLETFLPDLFCGKKVVTTRKYREFTAKIFQRSGYCTEM
jgi:hypothetical protein